MQRSVLRRGGKPTRYCPGLHNRVDVLEELEPDGLADVIDVRIVEAACARYCAHHRLESRDEAVPRGLLSSAGGGEDSSQLFGIHRTRPFLLGIRLT
jgi:hypothetical protein